MTVRYYSSTAQETTLQTGINNSATVILVAATTGFPVSVPYTLALDYESGAEELVDVTNAAGLSLTITRAVDGTSAAAHGAGARVRHVSSARDFRDSRDHENATQGVHGLGPTVNVVGDTTTQTLTNKTLTSPTINGGTFNSTIAGSPAFSGTPTFTNTVISGNIAGSPTFTSSPNFTTNGTIAGSPTFSGEIKSQRTNATDLSYSSKLAADAQNRFTITDGGKISWGSGSGASDTSIERTAPATNTHVGNLIISGGTLSGSSATFTGTVGANEVNATNNASVGGTLTAGTLVVTGVGRTVGIVKTANESVTSSTVIQDDNELMTTLTTGTYIFDCFVVLDSNTAGADINVQFNGTVTGNIAWYGAGAHNSMTTGSTAAGEWIARENLVNTTPYAASQSAGTVMGMHFTGSLICTVGGTFGLRWAQQTSNAAATTVKAGSFFKIHRVA